MAGRKQAKVAVQSRPEKRARLVAPPIDGGPLGWRFSSRDREGPFGWAIGDHDKFREVIDKLAEFEGRTWSEITEAGSHIIGCSRLCDAARTRLREIELDDLDELVSLRLTGTNRVWCIQSGNIMRILWWDADHQVYPVLPDKADRAKLRRRKGR